MGGVACGTPRVALADVVRTAALHRTHFEGRAALLVDDITQATQALTALADGRAHAAVVEGQTRALGGMVFVFPGQGSQWPRWVARSGSSRRSFAKR